MPLNTLAGGAARRAELIAQAACSSGFAGEHGYAAEAGKDRGGQPGVWMSDGDAANLALWIESVRTICR